MIHWRRWLGLIAAVVLTGYFVHFAVGAYGAGGFAPTGDMAIAIVVASLLSALVVPVSGLAWSVLLRSMGCNLGVGRLAAIIGYTQLAKYVPGNVMHHVGRSALALMEGVPPAPLFASMLIETIMLLAAGVAIGLVCISLSSVAIPLVGAPQAAEPAVFLLFVLATAVLVLLLAAWLPVLQRRYGQNVSNEVSRLPVPGATAITKVFVLYSVAYGVLGLSLWAIAAGQGGGINADLFALTAAFALSWLAGYLAPGVPAGLGAREGAMVLLLVNAGPSEQILALVVASRIATILADGICFAISAIILRKPKRDVST